MLINPKTAIAEGWISGLTDPEKQIQPNGIDFTADKAFRFTNSNKFYISETKKVMRGSIPYEPYTSELFAQNDVPCWNISGHEMLDFLSQVYVNIPDGVAAQLVIRSTLARNGLQLVSGIYDTGFSGHIGFFLHNRHQDWAVIAQGARVGQILFIKADQGGQYSGSYNHEKGTNLSYQEKNERSDVTIVEAGDEAISWIGKN